MLKRKRIMGLLAGVMALQMALPVSALSEEVPLYKFGSENTPVYMYNHEQYGQGEQVYAPMQFENKKEEHRATWVSTVSNIDFPKVSSEKEFREKFQDVVNKCKDYGLNTVIFQVRPMLDAWYQSDINPSSEFIDGKQGRELSFDPLAIAVEVTHNAGMELHAWFNPYRVTNSTTDYRIKEEKLADLDDMNFAKKNPELVYEFANKLFLDPGRPEVVKHVTDSIDEVLDKYDVDAIHFDDYFYPYKTTYNKVKIDENGNIVTDEDGKVVTERVTETMRERLDLDALTFENYSRGFDDVHEWREDNINTLVKSIDKTIEEHNKKTKNAVQFGISPFGIWDHKAKNKEGSHTPTSSTASLDDYVNTRAWAQNEWVDYLTPQIYWQFDQPAAPYGELVQWWNKQFEGVDESHLYIGHPNYKIIENTAIDFENPDEIPAQLRFNQKYSNVKGSAFFSFNKLDETINHGKPSLLRESYDVVGELEKRISLYDLAYDRNPIKHETNEIIKGYYDVSALPPAKPWLDQQVTKPVVNVKAAKSGENINLTWNDNKNNDTQFYVIYRSEGDTVDTTDPKNILDVIPMADGVHQLFEDKNVESGKKYTYAVSILDKAKVESEARVAKVK